MRRFLCVSCISVALFAGCTSSSAYQIQEKELGSPEEAITAFYESLVSADFAGCLQACAIREYSSKFNFAANIKRNSAMDRNWMSPAEYSLYAEINQAQQIGKLTQQIKTIYYRILGTEKFPGNATVDVVNDTQIEDDTQIEVFVQSINPENLRNLELVRIGIPYPSVINSESTQKSFKAHATIYGADERTERVALFTRDNSYYACCFTLYRYGKNWLISDLCSGFGGASYTEGIVNVSPEEFEKLISK